MANTSTAKGQIRKGVKVVDKAAMEAYHKEMLALHYKRFNLFVQQIHRDTVHPPCPTASRSRLPKPALRMDKYEMQRLFPERYWRMVEEEDEAEVMGLFREQRVKWSSFAITKMTKLELCMQE